MLRALFANYLKVCLPAQASLQQADVYTLVFGRVVKTKIMGKMCAKHSYDRSVVSNGFGYIAILFEVYYMRGREKKRTHYLFMFYKIVNVCLMVWSIEYSRFDQFRFGFSSFYAILFLFPSFWLLLPTPILLLLFFLFLMHWRKLLEWNCWTRSFGDVDHFANKLFNRQKKAI